jgi:hypothetical protein
MIIGRLVKNKVISGKNSSSVLGELKAFNIAESAEMGTTEEAVVKVYKRLADTVASTSV